LENFDFGNFKNGLYELTFCFLSSNVVCSSGLPCEMKINFGASRVYSASQAAGYQNSQHIGLIGLYPYISTANNSYLYAVFGDNPPNIISKPSQGTFTVQLLNPAGNAWVDSGANQMNSYILVLNFHKV
jgi:hypothetical protein